MWVGVCSDRHNPMRTLAIAAFFMLVPTVAFAQTTPDEVEPKQGSELQSRQLDLRAGVHTTPVLQYGGIGVGGDVGIARLGPGTLAAGGELSYDACGLMCVSTPYQKFQTHLWTEARLSYHLSTRRIAHVDFYPIATAGFVYAHSSIQVNDSEYRAGKLSPTISFGAGASWFMTKRFFISGEARLRVAAGEYGYELASGPAQTFDRSKVDSWTATTVDLGIAAGYRF